MLSLAKKVVLPLLWAAASHAPLAASASLEQITTYFGPNPTNVGFYIYVPDTLAAHPPILVNPHACHGNATQAFEGSTFASYADELGFIAIFPNSPNLADNCWDVSSYETLHHDAGGDSLGIVSQVRWTLEKYGGDARRVFVTGVSSGGMMTNTLLGAYPDLFAAGSAWADVPYSCFAAPGNNTGVYDYWNAACADGDVTHTAEQWLEAVRQAYPEYPVLGWRPKLQVFHGTVDQTVNYTNFLQDIVQWTAVFGLDPNPDARVTVLNTPLANWTQYKYYGYGLDFEAEDTSGLAAATSPWFEATSALNVPHNIPVQDDVIIEWFDLNCTSTTGRECFAWGVGGPYEFLRD